MHKMNFKCPSLAVLPLLLTMILLAACQPAVESEPDQDASTKTGQTNTESTQCETRAPLEPIACPMNYAPVCGCNDVTYSNACAAGAAGVPHFTEGACEDSDQT